MRNALVALLVVSSVGCGPGSVAAPAKAAPSPAPTIDQVKFEPLYRSGKAIEGALGTGVSLMKFGELLQNMATEIGIAKDKATRPDEIAMVSQFGQALAMFVSSRQTWQDRDAEAAQRIWTVAIPQLQAASRLYLSDAPGAARAIESSKAEFARQAEESAAAAADSAKTVADANAHMSTAQKIERIAFKLGDVDPRVRTKACNDLAAYGAVAEDQLSQLEANVNGETDEKAREAAKRAIVAIKAAIAKR